MLGSVIGLKKGYQIGITFFLEKLPNRLARMVKFISFAIMLFFLGVMVYYGTDQAIYNLRQISPAIRIPMTVPYAAIPVGAAMMFTVTVEELLKFLFVEPGTAKRA
jgi:TRAP-type C4-dicarboxylate transport system permease small subunit